MRSAWLAWPLSSSFRFLLCGSASGLCDMLAGHEGGSEGGSRRPAFAYARVRVCAYASVCACAGVTPRMAAVLREESSYFDARRHASATAGR